MVVESVFGFSEPVGTLSTTNRYQNYDYHVPARVG